MDISIVTVLYAQLAVLVAGTAYAWYQFAQVVKNNCDTCSVGLHKSPFRSKCFVGAVVFTAALACNILAILVV
jgi:hypothetical protein